LFALLPDGGHFIFRLLLLLLFFLFLLGFSLLFRF
jgi:hypothetical protein